MRVYPETSTVKRARILFVGALFLGLMILAYGGAYLKAWLDLRGPAEEAYTVIFTIWVTVTLLIPALCFHIFSRSNAPNTYWRAFWTFAYLAFLAHVYW